MQRNEPTLSNSFTSSGAHPLRRNAGVLLATLVALGAAGGAEAYRSRSWSGYRRGSRYGYHSRWSQKGQQFPPKQFAPKSKSVLKSAPRRTMTAETGARPSIPPTSEAPSGVAVVHESVVDGRVYAQPQSLGAAPAPASISEAAAASNSRRTAVRKPRRPLTLAEQKVANHAMRLAAKQSAFRARQAAYQAKMARMQTQDAATAAWMAHAAPGQVVTKPRPTQRVPAEKPVSTPVPEWKQRAWAERQERFRSNRYERRPLTSSRSIYTRTATRPVAPRPVAKPVAKVVAKKWITPVPVAAKPVTVKPLVKKVAPVQVAPKFPVAAVAAVSAAVPVVAHVMKAAPVTPAPVVEAPVTVAPAPAAPVAAVEAAPQPTTPVAVAPPVVPAVPTAPVSTDLESRPLSELHPEEKGGSRPASGNVLVDVLLKLVSVCGLIGASAFGWKKLQGMQGRKAAQSLETVQVNSTASLGPQRFLHVITVGQQRFLISSSPQQISLIATIDEGANADAALASAASAGLLEKLTAPPAPAPAPIPVAPLVPTAAATQDDARYNDLLRQIRAAGVSVDPTPSVPMPSVSMPSTPAPTPIPVEARPTFAGLSAAMNAPERGVSMFRTEIEMDEAPRNA